MKSIIDALESGSLLRGLIDQKPASAPSRLIREALLSWLSLPLDGEDYNLVVDAFVRRDLF